MTLDRFLVYFGYILLLINLICYLKVYSKKSFSFKLFTFYLAVTFIIQITTTTLRKLGINNVFLSHYYFISQFIILSIFFNNILKNKLQKRIIQFVFLTVLLTLTIYYFKYPSNYFRFNVLEIVITSFPLIIYSFFFFTQKVEGNNKKYIFIISGFFIFILCSTLLFTTGNITSSIKKIIWHSNATLYIVFQVLIFVEWYKNFRKPTTSRIK